MTYQQRNINVIFTVNQYSGIQPSFRAKRFIWYSTRSRRDVWRM